MLKTRPSASKTSVQMSDGPGMTSLVDFVWSRQSSDPDRIALRSSLRLSTNCLFTAILGLDTLLDHCYAIAIELLSSTSNFQLTTSAVARRYLYRKDPRGGSPRPGAGVYISHWNKHSVSFSLSGALQWTSHHWKSLSTISHAKV